MMPTLRRSLGEAAVVAMAGAAIALAVNGLRPSGVPLIAERPYQTLVPCPEPGGPVEAVAAGDPFVRSERTFLIDARLQAEFTDRHVTGAVNVPYDWLDPVPDQVLVELARAIAASGATRVVVYGDGGRPDSGEFLGREISGRGIKNVAYVRGGANAVLAPEAQ